MEEHTTNNSSGTASNVFTRRISQVWCHSCNSPTTAEFRDGEYECRQCGGSFVEELDQDIETFNPFAMNSNINNDNSDTTNNGNTNTNNNQRNPDPNRIGQAILEAFLGISPDATQNASTFSFNDSGTGGSARQGPNQARVFTFVGGRDGNFTMNSFDNGNFGTSGNSTSRASANAASSTAADTATSSSSTEENTEGTSGTNIADSGTSTEGNNAEIDTEDPNTAGAGTTETGPTETGTPGGGTSGTGFHGNPGNNDNGAAGVLNLLSALGVLPPAMNIPDADGMRSGGFTFVRGSGGPMMFGEFSRMMGGDAMTDQQLQQFLHQVLMSEGSSGPPPANETAIDALPRTTITEETDKESLGECSISQEGYEVGDVMVSLPCGHNFKEEPIVHWLKMHNACPVCRITIGGSNDTDSRNSS